MRLIDADALDEKVDALYYQNDGAPAHIDYNHGVADVMAVVHNLPAMPTAQRWIPVTERLPEDNARVLVTYSGGVVGTSTWRKKTNHNRGFDNYLQGFDENGNNYVFLVVAWMPLPDPYKEERHD